MIAYPFPHISYIMLDNEFQDQIWWKWKIKITRNFNFVIYVHSFQFEYKMCIPLTYIFGITAFRSVHCEIALCCFATCIFQRVCVVTLFCLHGGWLQIWLTFYCSTQLHLRNSYRSLPNGDTYGTSGFPILKVSSIHQSVRDKRKHTQHALDY